MFAIVRRGGKPPRLDSTFSPVTDTAGFVAVTRSSQHRIDGMMSRVTDLTAATDRLLATAARLDDGDWSAPSVCAGWSRAHVLAHLALNAEGLAGVLRGLVSGDARTMYASDEARDLDIVTLAAVEPPEIRVRLEEACEEFDAALDAVGPVAEGATFERTPGGQEMPADGIGLLRRWEVEIHHADLLAGYTYEDWPAATAWTFLVRSATRHSGGSGFHVHLTDHEPSGLVVGSPDAGAPTVTGPVRAVAWWLTGRDPGPVLSSSTGTLPHLEG